MEKMTIPMPLQIVSPKQAAEIVKLKQDGTINGPNQKKLLEYVIEENIKLLNESVDYRVTETK